MSRRASTKKHTKRGTAAWIPKTMKATKKIGQRTMKRVRFFLKSAKQTLVKLPGKVDRATSKRLHSYTRSRRH